MEAKSTLLSASVPAARARACRHHATRHAYHKICVGEGGASRAASQLLEPTAGYTWGRAGESHHRPSTRARRRIHAREGRGQHRRRPPSQQPLSWAVDPAFPGAAPLDPLPSSSAVAAATLEGGGSSPPEVGVAGPTALAVIAAFPCRHVINGGGQQHLLPLGEDERED